MFKKNVNALVLPQFPLKLKEKNFVLNTIWNI